MYRIAVLGDRDSIYGYAALGLDIYPVEDAEGAAKSLHHLAENGYAVIFVTEAVADTIASDISRYDGGILPAVVPIPGVSGNTGSGMAHVKKFVEQAVGSDIIFNGE